MKYSPSGDHFASVGSDYKVFLYEGKSGDTIGELTGDVHKGTVVRWDFTLTILHYYVNTL